MTLKESLEAGKEKGRKSRFKKYKRVFGGPIEILSPPVFKIIVKFLCEEYGQKLNSQWTGKDRGCAQNFIDYCLEAGEDPRELLRQVVQNWPRFFEGVIVGVKSGRSIRFSRSVDFGQFFQYRVEILDWLRHGGSSGKQKREYIRKEIDLRGGE